MPPVEVQEKRVVDERKDVRRLLAMREDPVGGTID